MKKVLFSLLAVGLAAGAFAQSKVADVAKFKAETIDLGKMKVNVPKTATFIVTNISKSPLIIETANPTCGCTIGDYTKAPIAPGKTGVITATFNAATVGPVQKSMNVKFAGVDEMKSINFTGEVLTEADFAKLPAGQQKTKVTPAATKKVKAASEKSK